MLSPAPSAHEFFWDDLLEFIEERRVIPIIGGELLTVPDGAGGEAPLHVVLAQRLAERLRVPADDCTGDDALHLVACRYVERGGRREDVYPRVRNLLRELNPPIPPLLRELARIRHFRLFVTTTFDTLLAQALDAERHGGAPRTVSFTYAPNHNQDLTPEARRGAEPVVYHLLGRASSAPDYVITEEDTLEFFAAMLGDSRRPAALLGELRTHHLLLIGNTFPDWLARFFIRIAKSGRLSNQREELEIIADRSASLDAKLVLFLRNFSYRTQIFEQGSAADFVRELAARYAERHPSEAPRGSADVPGRTDRNAGEDARAPGATPEMKPGSIFLSYASQDAAEVRKIRDALEAAGVDVWFDERQLESGDDFDLQIRKNIRACSLFLPIISANTQARHEGYFRLEWNLAVERTLLIAESIPFVLPIAISAIPESSALVPDKFLKYQWTRLPGGEPTAEFVERMVRLIRDHRKRERGLL